MENSPVKIVTITNNMTKVEETMEYIGKITEGMDVEDFINYLEDLRDATEQKLEDAEQYEMGN